MRRDPQPPEVEPIFAWNKISRRNQRTQPFRWWQWPIAWFQRYIRRPRLCKFCLDFGANRGEPMRRCISPTHLQAPSCAMKVGASSLNHLVALHDDDLRLKKKALRDMKNMHGDLPGDEWKKGDDDGKEPG